MHATTLRSKYPTSTTQIPTRSSGHQWGEGEGVELGPVVMSVDAERRGHGRPSAGSLAPRADTFSVCVETQYGAELSPADRVNEPICGGRAYCALFMSGRSLAASRR